ncbi:aminotransferase, class V [Hyphomonas neptunium ATCC 15444]|uniref:Aminotransferase, class V n=2 Tax=Hyphomonas TaxID=85 RepID=Q0BZ15_HYPNA|nr:MULTISPECIES: aminotransferase class V-fold PLP-dependent enzyme [Hyphomonas]ABI76715.1 aminotransferase, class V [Hyphomonas neptunium ATCC 15444]KCZ87274.1 class V aminotransferase [Hyphomonas hirschiana VP5]
MSQITRRNWLALGAATLAGAAACRSPAAASPAASVSPTAGNLPDRTSFNLGSSVYLNAGSQHPISRPARASIDAYLDHRADHAPGSDYELGSSNIIEKFARLVNADPDEITFVQSTTAGEQMIVRSLKLPASGARIVTDTLHFFGSMPMYGELAKAGCDVAWVKHRDGRISLEDMDRAITPGTRLVALSLVSTVNGFQHDLKAICDLAHSRGALVYADIIHAAGCIPVDLHASGVDFAACASYKWLMGDFGLGFLYVRKGARDALTRTQYGYYGVSRFTSHVYPFDPPGDDVASYAFEDTATGLFALGTYSHTTISLLNASLDYIASLGVEAIQRHAITLTSRLKEGLKTQGYELMTPEESQTPLVACVYQDARTRLGPKLKAAGITTTVSAHRFRPSVSVFNTMDDIELFLAAIGPA